MNLNSALIDKFWSKVDQREPDECWEWVGGRGARGYGSIYIKPNNYRANRVSWVIHNGVIPNNLDVLHKCDNPGCVNPSHLFLGDQADNNRDMTRKGRLWAPRMKLTPDDVRVIRSKYSREKENSMLLSREFGVSQATISRIVTGRIWKHVE